MSSKRFLAGLHLLCVCLGGFAVSAQADQVIMKNGDIITGKVNRIADGKVWIQPAYANEFGVASTEVEKLDAELLFEVELAEHEKVAGQFQLSADGKQQLVVDGKAQPVDLTTVAQAVEPVPLQWACGSCSTPRTWWTARSRSITITTSLTSFMARMT